MNLNDPKQKELLARYQQQLLAQYQKQMLAQQKAKQKAATVAAKQQQQSPKPHHQHPASAQPVAPKRMARRSIDEGKPVPLSEQKPPAQLRTNPLADQSISRSSSSSEGLPKRLSFGNNAPSTSLAPQTSKPDVDGAKQAEPAPETDTPDTSSAPEINTADATSPTAPAQTTPTTPNPTQIKSAGAGDAAMEEQTSIEVAFESSVGDKRKFDEIRPEPTNASSRVEETDVEMEQADDTQASTLAPPATQAMLIDGKSPAKKRARVADPDSGTSMQQEDAPTSEDLVTEVNKLKDENARLMEQVKFLEELSASHSAEKDRLSKELDSHKESAAKEVDSLRAQVTRLVDEMNSNSEDIEKTDASLKESICNLENELAAEREERASDGISLKETVSKLEKELADEREERVSEVNDLRADKAWLEALLEESKEKLIELAQESQKESCVKEEEMDTQSEGISELEIHIKQLSEKNSSLELRLKELSEIAPQSHEDTAMPLDADTTKDQGALLTQLAEAREISQKLQEQAETHTRDIQQKDAMIISMGETVAELRMRAKLENANDDVCLGSCPASDLLLCSEGAAETSEVSSQTNEPEILGAQKTYEDISSLKEELARVREQMAATLAEHNELKTKFETVRSEYKTEIAALGNSYETELESLKCSEKVPNSSSVYSDEDRSVRKADMNALADEGGATQDDVTETPNSAAPICAMDVENKIKLQHEQRVADFENQVVEHASHVKALEAGLQSKRYEIQRLHQQIAGFSNGASNEDSELENKNSPREPMSITVRRFRQWVGGVELTFDPRCEVVGDFVLRAARALHMAPRSSTESTFAEEASASMDLGEDTPRTAADESNKSDGMRAKSSGNLKCRLRRPGTEAEILWGTSLKSFDVVYVTTAAEEALFDLVSKEMAASSVCMRNDSSVAAVCG